VTRPCQDVGAVSAQEWTDRGRGDAP
jgi:hypothetical protein